MIQMKGVAKITASGASNRVNATIVQANVGVAAQVEAMFAKVMEDFGRLDILVNNAGVQTWKALLELTEDEWDRVLDTNLKGCFLCTQRAARIMKDAGGGRIVNIGSGCNKIGFPRLVDYTASKGGVRLFTKATAIQYAPDNIRCNSVHPGPIDTEMIRDTLSDPTLRAQRLQRIPLGKVGTAEDVAYGVLYLASDEASFVTGSELVIDGGTTAQ